MHNIDSNRFFCRLRALFSMQAIKSAFSILRSGELLFFIVRLYELLFKSPPDLKTLIAEGGGVNILATSHTMYVAYLVRDHLAYAGIEGRIIEKLEPSSKSNMLHIVICANMFTKLPRYMIAVQMEQTTSDRWFTRRYVHILRSRAIAVVDYSIRNIAFLSDNLRIPHQKLFLFPIGYSPSFGALFAPASEDEFTTVRERKYDLAFYGAMNERRRSVLRILEQHFSVLVISECFDVNLYAMLKQAKAVINIHYYEPALLETTRIHECLALGCKIFSEKSVDQSAHQEELGELIHFVDFDDPDSAVASIRRQLDLIPQAFVGHNSSDGMLRRSADSSRFYFLRMLVGLGVIDFRLLESLPLASPIPSRLEFVCLSLPETHQRRVRAWKPTNRNVELFDGIRHPIGWVGCALSYKFLATRALKKGVNQLTIFEDDLDPVRLDPVTLSSIDRYLLDHESQWDVFCGLITDLTSSASISRIEEFEGLLFIHLNKMTGMVFNIYARSALEILSCWRFDNEVTALTIDRHLEASSDLRVVTVLPFVAGHDEALSSTLWGFRNSVYNEWIVASQHRLGSMVSEFRSNAGAGTPLL